MELKYVMKAETRINSEIMRNNPVPEQLRIQFRIAFVATITLFGQKMLTFMQLKRF